jgi:hypothetical protein
MATAAAKPTPSWRDVLPIHPAAELFPLMTPDELRALSEDIKKNGLRVPIILWSESDNTEPKLLDGRNRLDAAQLAGIKVLEVRRDKGGRIDLYVPSRRLYGSGGGRSAIDGSSLTADPYEFVLSANIHRRHLTAEQRRELIAKLIKADPSKSDRSIAKTAKASPTFVGKVRAEKEATGDVSTVDTRRDTKGRQQPARRTSSAPPAKKSPPCVRSASEEVSYFLGRTDGLRLSEAAQRLLKTLIIECNDISEIGAADIVRAEQEVRNDIGPDSNCEAERLRARNEELERENRRLEIENIGLRSALWSASCSASCSTSGATHERRRLLSS